MVAQPLTRYNNGDILNDDPRKMISIISDNVFDDSTESRANSRNVEQPVSESDQDKPPQRQVQVRGDSKQGLSKFFDKVLRTAAPDEDEDAANKASLTTYSRSSIKVTLALYLISRHGK